VVVLVDNILLILEPLMVVLVVVDLVNLEDTAQLLVNQHQPCMELVLDMEMRVILVLTGVVTTV
tara:strand:+ start:154 stop:345 length:192 start_codon:yes stop_codon:yes gene_type:complete